jgi:hypothetical protein
VARWRGRRRGGIHGATAREEEEAAIGRRGEEEEGQMGCVGRKAGWAGWPLGRLGRKGRKNSFLNKNLIFEYTKALEICRRRFRRNFDMGIFPKFF